ncbi:SIS domain-containing protein [Oxalobacter aliiformigenes]|uniref:D-sedoheptulose-7-phosphate isomerase n=1 Tax=Oxalobacter aliiformigenes TaxID=2946593 RepID=UPI0022B010B1|nr:SIS domain-containing protein [Oxalobacter aliiformigenes]MCZ4064450.1 SIS domain-containing protein [Oxalobacter aliiformigenes]WAV99795.1 SIS domain-containing protein [Oxalobacter aliiformigenes]
MAKLNIYLSDLILSYSSLKPCLNDIARGFNAMVNCFQSGGKLLICGNGGSAADSLHIVGELMKGFVLPRYLPQSLQDKFWMYYPESAEYLSRNLQMPLPAVSLVNEVSLSTAYANDQASDLNFAQHLLGIGKEGDVLLAISTSGNSQNVLYACQVAKVLGLIVIGLTGNDGGKLKDIADISICVPEKETYKIQELHLPVYHALCLALEDQFFSNGIQ